NLNRHGVSFEVDYLPERLIAVPILHDGEIIEANAYTLFVSTLRNLYPDDITDDFENLGVPYQ
ncbi:MAG: hypothetical protein ABFS45_09135, partial [Pseudomonadota bacterium]